MKRLSIYIFSSLICLAAMGQSDTTEVSDTVIVEPDVKGLRATLFVDYGKIASTFLGYDEKYEGGLEFLFFDQYQLIGEYGIGTLNPENAIENGQYTAEGSYWRLGGGYLTAINQLSKLGIGVRYAASSFEDNGQYSFESGLNAQDEFTGIFERKELSARWVEFVLTSESNLVFTKENPESALNQLFILGFTLRFRSLISYDQFEPINVYAIPGYGRSVNDPNLALNLYLKIKLF